MSHPSAGNKIQRKMKIVCRLVQTDLLLKPTSGEQNNHLFFSFFFLLMPYLFMGEKKFLIFFAAIIQYYKGNIGYNKFLTYNHVRLANFKDTGFTQKGKITISCFMKLILNSSVRKTY